MAIPKILHYCWFGGNPLPHETLKYMESWKRYCPDFEIKVWDETTFDIHCCRYVEEAYKAKKWAFVADYARFYAMCHDGGVYVETDTEIIRPIEELLQYNAFFGFGTNTMTLPLCGTIKNSPVAQAMLDYYANKSFGKDGNYDTTTVNQILFNTLTSNFNLVHNNKFQLLDGNIAVYPREYFFSTDWQTGQIKKNPKLFVIHYADSSWLDDDKRELLLTRRKYIKLFGYRVGNVLGKLFLYGKKNGWHNTFIKVKSIIKRWYLHALMFFFNLIWFNKNKIVLENFAGKGYGDNPKYIAEELLSRDVKWDIVWLVKPGTNYKFPKGIRTVETGGWKELFELATSKIWIDNNRKGEWVRKSKNQTYLQTWHGFYPFKKIEKDAVKSLKPAYVAAAKHDSKMTDLMVSGCKARTELFRKSFWYTGEIMECGSPRNDIFFNNTDYKQLVADFFGISKEKKLLLYAPTFRDDHSLDAYNIDFRRVLGSLSSRFGGDWCILIRLHPAVREKSKDLISYDDQIVDASSYDDIQELFAASDVLITDYSNCMSEFSLQLKPVILYASDIKAYSQGRSFYYDIHELPYPIAENNDELNDIIDSFDILAYKNNLDSFLKSIGSFEKGTASKEVVDFIVNIMNEE